MSAGTYTVTNSLADKVYPVLNGKVHVVNGIMSGVNISCGGTCTSVTPYGPIDNDCESYSNDYAIASPGASVEYQPPVPPTGPSHCPPNTPWTLTYTITGTGNKNAFAQGSFTLPLYKLYNIDFGYHLNAVNGTAWYSYTLTEYINGVAGSPTLYSIGDLPAATASSGEV